MVKFKIQIYFSLKFALIAPGTVKCFFTASAKFDGAEGKNWPKVTRWPVSRQNLILSRTKYELVDI